MALDGVGPRRAGGRRVRAARGRPIGVVFQDLLLFPHLSAPETSRSRCARAASPEAEARERSGRAPRRLGRPNRADAQPRDLSGGEAQRVALAGRSSPSPRCCSSTNRCRRSTSARARGSRRSSGTSSRRFPGVRVIVTHDPVEASMLAERLVLLEDGGVTQTGTPEEIRAAPRSRYAADLVGVNAFRGHPRAARGGDRPARLERRRRRRPLARRVRGRRGRSACSGPPTSRSRSIARTDRLATSCPGRVDVDRGGRGPRPRAHRDRAAPRCGGHPGVGGAPRAAGGVEVWASFKAVEVELLPP